MIEIECPLCAETIDLGMAEEGEYECPYCEDVFHWKPEESRDIENHQCPKGCGQLSKVVRSSGEIAYYKCHKCEGSLLNAEYIGTILEDMSDRRGDLKTIMDTLEQGVLCDLDCPTCKGKMVEVKVYYQPPSPDAPRMRHMGGLADVYLSLMLELVVGGIERSKHNYEGTVNYAIGMATLILDGCGDCGSFWFDKGEIERIRESEHTRID